MPRDVNGVYTPPAGTHGVPDTPILSNRYNAYVDDMTHDQNEPRPVVAGGTGGHTPGEAAAALEVVSYGAAQPLSAPQQAQARANAGLDYTPGTIALSALDNGLLEIPAEGDHFVVTGVPTSGNATFTIADFGDLRPPGKSFTVHFERTNPLPSGTNNYYGPRMVLVHSASGPGLDMTANLRMDDASPAYTYDAVPNARDAIGQGAALFEQLAFIPLGAGRHKLIELPAPAWGRNENGVWVRHANGLQICTRIMSVGEETGWTFPARFVDDAVNIQATAGVSTISSGSRVVSKHNDSVSVAGVQLSRFNSTTGNTANFAGTGVQATGFWK